jgi:DNA-binding NarL/FixJ family response regulator
LTSVATRLLLADDHVIVREGVKVLLVQEGFDVVADASDGLEAVRLAGTFQPDIAVLDLVMPLLNGIDAGREIATVSPRTKTILLTSRDDESVLLEALQAGFSGCVLKSYRSGDLVRAIRDVAAGGTYMSAEVSRSLVAAYRARSPRPVDPLTNRERQVLQLLAEGKRTREVAELLGVSGKTAESHRAHIMKKLGITHTAGLVRYALQRGLTAIGTAGFMLDSLLEFAAGDGLMAIALVL